ncbi:MAG: CAP domain-containing protein [Planctomycetota bacterium]|jgi:uncharacterized protein YkwD
MNRNSQGYYRISIISLLLSAGCAGSFDPLFPSLDLELDTVLSSGQQNAAYETNLPECIEAGEPGTSVHGDLFEALNQYRVENGLEPLIYSEKLEAVANAHVYDTWSRGYFAHVNPEGQGPSDRALEAGFCHKYVGENLAAGQKSVDLAMEAWKNSPTHNKNMLIKDYVYGGVGFFQDPLGRLYWAQLFAYDVR